MAKNALNTLFICGTKHEFEWRCLSLLVDAYVTIKSKQIVDIDCEEEYISAVFLDFIDTYPKAINWHIDITPEFRLYKEAVLRKNQSAKEAPRIDFRLCGWARKSKLIYFVEAKNLIETDAIKAGRKTPISAYNLHKRYIETGIDNYVSGKYPSNGCLVGYILQGQKDIIINKLNKCLSDNNRNSEILQKQSFRLKDFNLCYLSKHTNSFSIKHLMFEFT